MQSDGKSYIPLPHKLSISKSVINVKNKDEKGFSWSVLASLYPQRGSAHKQSKYKRFINSVDMSGISYYVHPTDMTKFEKQSNISVTVIGYQDKQLFPIYLTKSKEARHHVNLLYLCNRNNQHWCLIKKKLNRFLCHTRARGHSYYFCRYCLQGFRSDATLSNHLQYCSRHGAQSTTFLIREMMIRYNTLNSGNRFVIYCDFETLNTKHTCYPDLSKSSTTPTTKCEPCGYGYKVVCVDSRYTKPTVIFRGQHASKHFFKALLSERAYIKDVLSM